jgi:hypothetical protein
MGDIKPLFSDDLNNLPSHLFANIFQTLLLANENRRENFISKKSTTVSLKYYIYKNLDIGLKSLNGHIFSHGQK